MGVVNVSNPRVPSLLQAKKKKKKKDSAQSATDAESIRPIRGGRQDIGKRRRKEECILPSGAVVSRGSRWGEGCVCVEMMEDMGGGGE